MILLSPTNLKWSSGRSKGKATGRKGRPRSGRSRLVRCHRQSPTFAATKTTVGTSLRFLPERNTECGRKLRASRSLARHRKPKKLLSMLNRKTLSVTLVALVSIVGTFLYTMWQHNGPGKIANRQAQVAKDLVKVTEPMTSTLRNFNPVAPSVVKPRREVPPPVQVAVPRGVEEAESSKSTVSWTLTIFAAQEQPDKPRSGPRGDYAPAFRLVKCQLVNTVDSSNLTTPVIGLVAEDLCWNGRMIIRANSEVHSVASVDRVRERIASEVEFTFVLNEPDGRGRELGARGSARCC